MTDEKREKALEKWWVEPLPLDSMSTYVDAQNAFRAGYDAASADSAEREKALEAWWADPLNSIGTHTDARIGFRAGYAACDADNAERVKPPDYGIDHKLLCDWINSLPEPFRAFVTSLETDADPSGNIRDAVCQRENAMALAERVKELEQHFEQLNNDRLAAESQLAEARATIEEQGKHLAMYREMNGSKP